MKKLFKSLPLLLVLACSGNALAAPPSPSTSLNPDVTPLKVEKNDVADVLGILMWKFRITTKQPNTKLVFKLSYDPLSTKFTPPTIPEFRYTQRAMTEDILVASYPQSDGLHYFIRAEWAKWPYVQEDKFVGWVTSYGVEDGVVLSRRTGDSFDLFEFVRRAIGQRELETLKVSLTVEPAVK